MHTKTHFSGLSPTMYCRGRYFAENGWFYEGHFLGAFKRNRQQRKKCNVVGMEIYKKNYEIS